MGGDVEKRKKGKQGGKLTVDNLVNNSFFQAWAIIMTLYGQLKGKWEGGGSWLFPFL